MMFFVQYCAVNTYLTNTINSKLKPQNVKNLCATIGIFIRNASFHEKF